MLFELHTPYEKNNKKASDIFPQIMMLDAEYHIFNGREYIDICDFEQVKKLINSLPSCIVNGSICEQKIDITPKDWEYKCKE